MSAIPIALFGLTVVLAICSIFIERYRKGWVASKEEESATADLLAALLYSLFGLGVTAQFRLAGKNAQRLKKGGGGEGTAEDVVKIVIKLIPPFMRVLISAASATAGFWILFSHEFTAGDKHWACTTLGTILGYWLKR